MKTSFYADAWDGTATALAAPPQVDAKTHLAPQRPRDRADASDGGTTDEHLAQSYPSEPGCDDETAKWIPVVIPLSGVALSVIAYLIVAMTR